MVIFSRDVISFFVIFHHPASPWPRFNFNCRSAIFFASLRQRFSLFSAKSFSLTTSFCRSVSGRFFLLGSSLKGITMWQLFRIFLLSEYIFPLASWPILRFMFLFFCWFCFIGKFYGSLFVRLPPEPLWLLSLSCPFSPFPHSHPLAWKSDWRLDDIINSFGLFDLRRWHRFQLDVSRFAVISIFHSLDSLNRNCRKIYFEMSSMA